jgi:hypothetical protein
MESEESPPAARTAAATALLDRAFGKPATNIEARIDVTDPAATAAAVLLELSQRAKERRAEAMVIDAVPLPRQ